ncbi:MAG: roadblock/LC7 domain-containing protein [Verrucomicrobiota bacterium]|jgi:predicted regulator of Ras-like GTPase activity (Roadblock/LC7/MglB family)
MFAFLKNIILGKPVEDRVGETQEPAPESAVPPVAPAPARPSVNGLPPRPPPRTHATGNGNSVEVSLQSVLGTFPPELKGRIRQSDVGEATVSIPIEKVLPQLEVGAAKISFGELRRAAPQLFTSGSDCDQIMVTLPLNEILLQVDPALLPRRQNQKHIAVPDEIRSPFGDNGDGLIFSVGPTKAETPAPPRATTLAPPRATTPAAPRAFPPAAPVPPAPVPQKPAPPAPTPPAKPPMPQLMPLQPISFRGSMGSTPTPHAPVVKPAGFPPASRVPAAFRGVGAVTPPLTPRESSLPRPPTLAHDPIPQPPKPTFDVPSLHVPLMTLTEGWPEALRHEIVQLNLTDANVALPAQAVEQALKRGKVAFPWKVLRSWIKPAPLPTVSVHDNAALELPLKVIAPLFLTRQKDAGKSQQRVAIDENIPNLFFGLPQPGAPSADGGAAAPSHAVSKPLDTNYYVWNDSSDTAQIVESDFKPNPKASPGTTFVTRCATPNEVASRAAALDGVAGALIALPDGLMVASRLSPDLNGDTLAAFLPHIFGKVSQCTKELRMGELNNLNFTVGNVPWKIFRVHAIFFAAFGHPGQPLPTAQLAELAAELDRKKQ